MWSNVKREMLFSARCRRSSKAPGSGEKLSTKRVGNQVDLRERTASSPPSNAVFITREMPLFNVSKTPLSVSPVPSGNSVVNKVNR